MIKLQTHKHLGKKIPGTDKGMICIHWRWKKKRSPNIWAELLSYWRERFIEGMETNKNPLGSLKHCNF